MAKIKNTTAYPTVTPSTSDLIIGTDVNDNNKTVTFLVGALGGGVAVNQDLDSVLGVGNTSLLNIELNGNASALGSSISVIDIFPTTISAGGLGSHGSAGQVLSSTGTGLAWVNATGATQSWNDTLAISPIATANPVLTGIFTFNTGGGLDLNGTSYLNVRGLSRFYNTVTIDDGVPVDFSTTSKILINSAAGTAGQFLSATATGMQWSSASTITSPTLQQVVDAGNTLLDSSIVFTGTGGISLTSTNTITGQGVINLNGNGTPTSSATYGRIIMSQGSIALSGANNQILLGGSSGTSGQALVSNGPFITPSWQTISGSSATLQQVLDNGNTATQNMTLTGNITIQGGGLLLGSNAYIELNGDRGILGQVLSSGGPGGFPTWVSAGTGTVTAVNVKDTTYLDMSVDVSTPSTPSLSTALVTTGQVTTGPGGLTQAFYVDDITGTNYSIGSGLATVATVGSGSGIVVTIISTVAGSITLANLAFVSGGSGYLAGDKFQITQAGSDNNCIIELDDIVTGTFYDQTGKFSKPKGADWDITVTNVGSSMVITNSDGVNSSFFTLQGGGGAVFSNQGGNIIELDFTGSGSGSVQSISLTDSTATVGTAITTNGSFTFSEQAATSTYLRTTSAVSGLGITLSTETPTIQAVATVGATLLNTALTIQNGNGTTNNSFVLGTTAAPSVATAGQVLAYNSTGGGYMEWVAQTGGGNMTSWDLTGDTGGAGTVLDGETVNIVGGTGIDTVSTPGTRTITISATGTTLTSAGNANSVVGTNNALTVTFVSGTGSGYVANNYYPTTAASVTIGSATGLIARVISVDATGGITGASVYGGGKDWTVGDTLTVDFGTTSATLTVASIGTTETVTTTWRGLSGTAPVDVLGGFNYTISTIPRFRSNLTSYSSNIAEFAGDGTGVYTDTALRIGNFNVAVPVNGQQIYVENNIGIVSEANFANIRIGHNGGNTFSASSTNNVSMGHNSLFSLTTGDSNIAIGLRALTANTTGNGNIGIGDNALANAASGGTSQIFNTAVGYNAGSNAYGSYDTLYGNGAGENIINNSAAPLTQEQMIRVAIGRNAMSGESTSNDVRRRYNGGDIAIGSSAQRFQCTSNTLSNGASVYIGVGAGQGVPNGVALQSIFRSGHQVVIGGDAMLYGHGGREGQVAIGYGASIGSSTLGIDTINTSTKGIAIGYQAEGTSAVANGITRSGVGNIAIGVNAGGIASGVIQGSTIAIGTSSMGEGTDAIALGRFSRAGGSGLVGSIAIGLQATSQFAYSVAIGRGATATDANQFVVGSTTYSVGTTTTETIAASDTTWVVKINGQDYKIPMLAV